MTHARRTRPSGPLHRAAAPLRAALPLLAALGLGGCVVFGPDGLAVPGTGIATSPAAAAAADSFIGIQPAVIATTDADSRLLNALRAEVGQPLLARAPAMDGAAAAHAAEMAGTGQYVQEGLDGSSAMDRIGQVCSRTATEMIAVGVPDFAGALAQWRTQPAASRELQRQRWSRFGLANAGDIWVLNLSTFCPDGAPIADAPIAAAPVAASAAPPLSATAPVPAPAAAPILSPGVPDPEIVQ